jgi:hypothetical protein
MFQKFNLRLKKIRVTIFLWINEYGKKEKKIKVKFIKHFKM